MILGAGPVGLIAALSAARTRRVLLCAPPRTASAPSRIDSFPAPFLALLIELGLHPLRLAPALHDRLVVAWESTEPEVRHVSRRAHLDRGLLEQELHALAAQSRSIEWAPAPPRDLPTGTPIFDATGRRAVTALGVERPAEPWFARCWLASGVFTPAQQLLRIAALPGGYAYRIGVADLLTLGLVGPHQPRAVGQAAWRRRLLDSGAEWMVEDLPPETVFAPGRGGEASVQWSRPGADAAPVGDAAFARDALAAQGTANGVSDALASLEDVAAARERIVEDRRAHAANLRDMIARGRFRDAPDWRTYDAFLCGLKERAELSQ
ncbi:MAG: hypothetical protein ACREE0_15120 [Phenylobacterium sp.]